MLVTAVDHVGAAERLLRGRRLRAETLGILNDAFGEPAWDMLLRLFVDDGRGRSTTIGALLEEAGGEDTRARAYLGFLETHDIVAGADLDEVVRGTDDRLIVRLSDRGRERMRSYLEQEAHDELHER